MMFRPTLYVHADTMKQSYLQYAVKSFKLANICHIQICASTCTWCIVVVKYDEFTWLIKFSSFTSLAAVSQYGVTSLLIILTLLQAIKLVEDSLSCGSIR